MIITFFRVWSLKLKSEDECGKNGGICAAILTISWTLILQVSL